MRWPAEADEAISRSRAQPGAVDSRIQMMSGGNTWHDKLRQSGPAITGVSSSVSVQLSTNVCQSSKANGLCTIELVVGLCGALCAADDSISSKANGLCTIEFVVAPCSALVVGAPAISVAVKLDITHTFFLC